MSTAVKSQYSSVLQVAVFSFVAAMGFVLCAVLFFPLRADIHWYVANVALALITTYIFDRVLAYSQHPKSRKRADRGFIVHPLPAIGVVVVPALLNFLYRIEPHLPDQQAVMIGRMATLALLVALALCLLVMVISAPVTARGTFSEYITLPVTILSLIVLLGSDRAFSYLTHVVPPQAADLNLTLRNAVAAILALAIFFDFARLWFRRGQEFSEIIKDSQDRVPRRHDGREINAKNGPLQYSDVFRLIVHNTLKYPTLVVTIVGKFLVIILQSAYYSVRGLLFTPRFLLGLVFSLLIITTLIMEHLSGDVLTTLDEITDTNRYNQTVIIYTLAYSAWIALIIFCYVKLCYQYTHGLFQSMLLVFSMCLCGMWLGSLIIHGAVTLGWLQAPGFAFSRYNPFFWFMAVLGFIGLTVGGRLVWGGEGAATDRRPPDPERPSPAPSPSRKASQAAPTSTPMPPPARPNEKLGLRDSTFPEDGNRFGYTPTTGKDAG